MRHHLEGAPIGVRDAEPDDLPAIVEIYNAAIAEAHRREGIGGALLARAIAVAPGIGLSNLLAFVFAHNDASVALFVAHGFERWGNLPGVASMDGVTRDLLILGLHLVGEEGLDA